MSTNENEDTYDEPAFSPSVVVVMSRDMYRIHKQSIQPYAYLVAEQTDPYEFQVLKTRFCEDPGEPVGFGTIAEMVERTTLEGHG